MTNALLTCATCNDIFKSRSELNYHVKRDHQSSVKVKFQNGGATEVKRAEDNTFKCKCGKIFKLPGSLRRHARICRGELMEQEEDGRGAELMDIDVSDASKSLNLDDRIILTDCFGALICHEKY
jgi:uncharacterized C2H2 Zn-finger protein